MGGIFGSGSTITNSESKIGALQIQQSTYGVPIPVIFGTNRVAGNLLDYIDFKAIPHTTTQKSGGKGGGKVTQSNTTYTYTVMLIIGLCEGEIAGIGRIWNDKSIEDLASIGLSLFAGAPGQSPWSEMQSKHPERALNYPKTTYVASSIFDLDSSASLPNLTFEVKGRNLFSGSLDANPKDIIIAILSDAQIGVGFPAQYIADLTQFSNYCIANKVLFSPAFTSQDEANAPITTLCQAANSEPVWSQGKLKIVPYGLEAITANGVTYTPPPSPIYDLTIDDFVYAEGDPPVKVKPNLTADRYNIQPVEIMNRTNDYNIEPIKATDDTNIGDVGPRPADSIEMHFITDPDVGQFAAQSILQRQLYVPKQYEFTLTWRHCLLDSMDVVTITELDFLGLFKEPVRIVEIKEDESFNLTVTAEDCPEGVHSPALYSTQLATRPTLNYNIDPGNINPPVIFEAPAALTSNGLEIWIGASGGNLWGSCNVWISEDGNTFKRIGSLDNPSKQGVLKTILNSASDPDTTNILSVDLSMSRGELFTGTKEDADNLNTICYIDGEFISYQTATLTGMNQYNLTYLRRGAYNSTIKNHAINSKFVRLNEALFKYPFTLNDVGKKIYFKFTSKNIYGIREQRLENVEPYTYIIQVTAPDSGIEFTVTQNYGNLIAALKNNYTNNDYLAVFTYELRMGPTWEKAILINRFSGGTYTFDAPNEGTLTFWLKVVDQVGNYSKTATRAIVNVINLPVRNIIFDRQENTDLWIVTNMWRDQSNRYRIKSAMTIGEYEYFADMFGNELYLRSDAEIIMPLIDLGPNILDESCYWIDSAGNVRLKTVQTLADFERFSDIFGAKLTEMKPSFAKETFVGVEVQHTIRGNARIDIEYRTSMDGEQWSNWIPSSIKQFSGRYVQIRLLPISIDGLGQVYISGATISIDVNDIEEIIDNVDIPAARTRITYKRKFTEVKSVSPYTQDLTGKQATCYIADQTNDYVDLEILDQNGILIPGKLQKATIRGY